MNWLSQRIHLSVWVPRYFALGKRLYAPSLIPNFVKSIEKIQFYRRNSEVYGSERPVQPKIFKSTEPSGRKTTPSASSSRR